MKFSLRGIPTNGSQRRPVLVLSELRSWMARPQLARAYAMQGDTAKAKAAHQDFLTLAMRIGISGGRRLFRKAEYAKTIVVLAEILRSSFVNSW